MTGYSIGQLAARTGAKVVTIRYYEKIELLEAPRRSRGGHRLYDGQAITRLNFIRRSRKLGLSLEAIADLLRLAETPDSPCDNADRIAKSQLRDIRTRMRELRAMERALSRILEEPCGGRARDCGILGILSPEQTN
ncbi:MerR family transcriptional regulator [Euryhalocaulis caribicus]|uniref:MerR family transcriptional regulator n=1 Tax=Euryhalocaulis caribicus TaxID=1161401 RepID=UPI0003B67B66|nr:helix-turn-helix domain-containing protein [Euryhalocaulis caribicus]